MSKLFVVEGSAETWREALKITSGILLEQNCVCDDFYENCVEREINYPTGLTEFCPIAIPHTSKDHVKQEAVCALRLAKPVKFHRMDDNEAVVQVKYVLNLAFLDDNEHLELISRIIRCIKDTGFVEEMDRMSVEELYAFLREKFLRK